MDFTVVLRRNYFAQQHCSKKSIALSMRVSAAKSEHEKNFLAVPAVSIHVEVLERSFGVFERANFAASQVPVRSIHFNLEPKLRSKCARDTCKSRNV